MTPFVPEAAMVMALRFYDHMTDHATEPAAERQAQLYLQRKLPDMPYADVAIALRDALERRKAARLARVVQLYPTEVTA